jgi:hypothetical protein
MTHVNTNTIEGLYGAYIDHTGDFTIEMAWEIVSAGSGGDRRLAYCRLNTIADVDAFAYRQIVGGTDNIYAAIGGTTASYASTATSGTTRFKRVSGTLTISINVGGGWVDLVSASYTGGFRMIMLNWGTGGTSGTISSKWTDISVTA